MEHKSEIVYSVNYVNSKSDFPFIQGDLNLFKIAADMKEGRLLFKIKKEWNSGRMINGSETVNIAHYWVEYSVHYIFVLHCGYSIECYIDQADERIFNITIHHEELDEDYLDSLGYDGQFITCKNCKFVESNAILNIDWELTRVEKYESQSNQANFTFDIKNSIFSLGLWAHLSYTILPIGQLCIKTRENFEQEIKKKFLSQDITGRIQKYRKFDITYDYSHIIIDFVYNNLCFTAEIYVDNHSGNANYCINVVNNYTNIKNDVIDGDFLFIKNDLSNIKSSVFNFTFGDECHTLNYNT